LDAAAKSDASWMARMKKNSQVPTKSQPPIKSPLDSRQTRGSSEALFPSKPSLVHSPHRQKTHNASVNMAGTILPHRSNNSPKSILKKPKYSSPNNQDAKISRSSQPLQDFQEQEGEGGGGVRFVAEPPSRHYEDWEESEEHGDDSYQEEDRIDQRERPSQKVHYNKRSKENRAKKRRKRASKRSFLGRFMNRRRTYEEN